MKTKKSVFDVSLVDLLEAGSHFGHQAKRWNPRMKPYIWKAKDGVHIFDLSITAQKIKEAAEKIAEVVRGGGKIVFVGTKRQAKVVITEEAQRCGAYYVSNRWPGGLVTNWRQISKSIRELEKLKEGQEKGEHNKYTKKENVLIQRKIQRLERLVGGLVGLQKPPDVIFVVDTLREKTAVKEARAKGILVVAMADSNSDPDLIDLLIPANDDAIRSIKLVVSKMADAVIMGQNQTKTAPKTNKETKKEAKNDHQSK
jgi:small subunit ribosomal protein S2